jgi:hypothetical protein
MELENQFEDFTRLLNEFPNKRVRVLDETPVTGPDGWPYLMITDAEGDEPTVNILKWANENGVGIVLNPELEEPTLLLTYGMIWNFHVNGKFLNDLNTTGLGGSISGSQILAGTPVGDAILENERKWLVDANTPVLAGDADPRFLPLFVRAILKEFLRQQSVENPKFLVIGKDNKFDLCFSLESMGSPPEREHQGVLQALSWFLPAHYSLVLVGEKGMPKFIDL